MSKKIYSKKYHREHSRKWYDENRELALMRSKKWNGEHSQRMKQLWADRWKALKTEVLAHYSGVSPPICVACGENQLPCLSIDHINNDGYKEGRARSGTRLYLRLKKEGYPLGFQALCANCQCIKRDLFNQEKRRSNAPSNPR